MKRLSAVVAALALSLGMASCGGYEQVDISGLENSPTGTLSFAATNAADLRLNIGSTSYSGTAITANPCRDATEFTGVCAALSSSSATPPGAHTETNLCIGTWGFTNITIHPTGVDCSATALATCVDATGVNIVPGTNTVNLTCNVVGSSVTFNVTLQ